MSLLPMLLAMAAPVFQMEHLANAGVLLRCGDETVIVDGLFREGVAGYAVLGAEQREALEMGKAPYANIRLVLATHLHKDHFDAGAVNRHLLSNRNAIAGGPPQVTSQLKGSTVWTLQPGERRQVGNIEVRTFRVPHNEPHDKTIENNVYLLTLCGKRVIVTGDAIQSPQAFRDAGLAGLKPDIVVAPWWFALSIRGREILDEVMQAPEFWAVHGDLKDRERWMAAVRKQYPKAVIP